jgi:perosamine synthetase
MIPVSKPLLDGNEKRYLAECIDTGWISSEGPFVTRLEGFFAAYCGRKHAVAVCNGSAALDLAVSSLDLEEGDEVILPSFTIISCVQAILRAGARPVVVDCDPVTWTMTAGAVETAITSRTKAIMPVHIYGLPCNMDPLMALASRYGLHIIEDAAEAHGLTYKDQPCGSFGDVATFSFYSNKLVTTGEGGMVLTDDDDIADRLRSRRNLCFQPDKRFVHEELGWNMRMSNMQAAVGCAQTERLPNMVERKREIGRRYQTLLRDTRGLQLPCARTDAAENIYWVFGVILGPEHTLSAKACMADLAREGIATRPFFWPIHEQPVLRRLGLFEGVRLPVSETLARRGFYIPSGPAITHEEQEFVARALTRTLETH